MGREVRRDRLHRPEVIRSPTKKATKRRKSTGVRVRPNQLSLEPQNVDRYTWYYEEPKGICVIRQLRNKDDVLYQSDTFYLPWKKLETSVERYRDAKSKSAVLHFGKNKK